MVKEVFYFDAYFAFEKVGWGDRRICMAETMCDSTR